MFNIEQYTNWISKRAQIDYKECVKDIDNLDVKEIIGKCNFPQKLLGFLFLPPKKAFQKLNTFYLPENGEYTKKKYYDNETLINKYTIVCTANGNAICINDETGAIEEIDNTNFEVSFVNKSLEEFLEFLLYYAEMLSEVEDVSRNITRVNLLKRENVEGFKKKISDEAGAFWEEYTFWKNKIEFLYFYVGLKES